MIGGLWSAAAGIIVIESTFEKTTLSAKVRVAGSFIGALIGGIYLLLFPFTFRYKTCQIYYLISHP